MRRRPTARGTLKRKRSSVVSHQHVRAAQWRFFSAKTLPTPNCSARRTATGSQAAWAGSRELDRGSSTLSPVQHGETAVIRGYDAGATERQRRHAGAASAWPRCALLVRELRRLHDVLDRIEGTACSPLPRLTPSALMLLGLGSNFNHIRVRSFVLGGAPCRMQPSLRSPALPYDDDEVVDETERCTRPERRSRRISARDQSGDREVPGLSPSLVSRAGHRRGAGGDIVDGVGSDKSRVASVASAARRAAPAHFASTYSTK